MKKTVCGLLVFIIMLLCVGGAGADPDLTLQDYSVQHGPWAEAYTRILKERSEGIRAYQDYVAEVTYLQECRPVGLMDLTGDGIPELFFLDLIDDTEYGFRVGRLWVYAQGGQGVHCILTLQPEIDDLLYSDVYLGKDGLLTVYLNDCEMGWKLQLLPDRNGVYEVRTILNEQEDFSGEGPDTYYLNGRKISVAAYRSEMKKIQAAQGTRIGSLQVDDGGSGFTLTLEEAMEKLASGKMHDQTD